MACRHGSEAEVSCFPEIQYFRDYYKDLKPAVFQSYEREAWYALDGGDFRVTFDENILYRREDFSLGSVGAGLEESVGGRCSFRCGG